MKEYLIKIRIIPTEDLGETNSKSSFWSYINLHKKNEINDPERLEIVFRRHFIKNFHQILEGKFIHELNETQKFRYKYFNIKPEYKKSLHKIQLAKKVEVSIVNITYSSLLFDLLPAPIDTLIELFDGDCDILKVFLTNYIPQIFLESINISQDEIEDFPISVDVDFSPALVEKFLDYSKTREKYGYIGSNKQSISSLSNANWLWIISNYSLVVPALLIIFVYYQTFQKIETVFKIRQDSYREMRMDNENILKSYQELIKLQQKTFSKMIKESKKDSIK